jgi:hypothetical protein
MWPENLRAEDLAGIYLAANTPAYLLKHFRRSPIVERLGKELNVEQLSELLAAILSQRERTSLDIAKAYAALIAISTRNYSEWMEPIRNLDLARLDWGNELREQMRQQAVPFGITVLQQSSNAASVLQTNIGTQSDIIPPTRPQSIILVD